MGIFHCHVWFPIYGKRFPTNSRLLWANLYSICFRLWPRNLQQWHITHLEFEVEPNKNHHIQKKHRNDLNIITKIKTNQNRSRPTNILLQHRPSPEETNTLFSSACSDCTGWTDWTGIIMYGTSTAKAAQVKPLNLWKWEGCDREDGFGESWRKVPAWGFLMFQEGLDSWILRCMFDNF